MVCGFSPNQCRALACVALLSLLYRWCSSLVLLQESQRKYRVKLDTLSGRQLGMLTLFLVGAIILITAVGMMGPAPMDEKNPSTKSPCESCV